MPDRKLKSTDELIVVILATGKESGTAVARLILLQDLGGRKVVAYVFQKAVQLVTPTDI